MSNDQAKGRKVPGCYLTRASRVMLACILVAVAIWPMGIPPQATHAAPVHAPSALTPGESGSSAAPQAVGEWKIYRDMRYGFSLALPSEWHVSPAPLEGSFATTMVTNYDPAEAIEASEPYPRAVKLEFVVFPFSGWQTLENWVDYFVRMQTQSEIGQAQSVSVERRQSITLDGRAAIQIQLSSSSSLPVLYTAVPYRDQSVLLVSTAPTDSTAFPDAQLVLSTLELDRSEDAVSPIVLAPFAVVPPPPVSAQEIHPCGDWGREAPDSPIPLYMPFHDGETWIVGGSGSFYGDYFHTNAYNDYYATDWNMPGAGDADLGRDVLPIADGTIIAVHPWDGALGNWVEIDHGNGVRSAYAHLQTILKTSGWVDHWTPIGKVGGTGGWSPHLHLRFRVSQNSQFYSHCYNSNWNYNKNCGNNAVWPQSPKPSPMYTQSGSRALCDGYTYTSNNSGNGPCPQSGGVILYWHKDYNCDNGEGDPGYRQRTSTGFENISGAFNDDASSLRVPSGWSVRLYEHADRGGDSTCRNVDDNNFEGQNFDASSVGLNDKVSSFEVFDNSTNCNPGSPPPKVELWSLANWDGDIVFSEGAGFSNEPNADSYSMKIPRGWSVKTWRGDNRGGGEPRCWSESVRNLQDHGWHRAIESIEVFDSDVCPMRLNFTTGLGRQIEVEIVVTSVGDYDDQLSQNNVTTNPQGNGSVELSGCVVSGKHYDIYAKPRGYLRQKKSNVLLQPGTNSVSFDSAFKKGDTNNDNSIGIMDLLLVLARWDSPDPYADVTGDGTVNIADLLLVLDNWGRGAGWTDSRDLQCGTAAMGAQDAIRAQEANGSITLSPDAGTFNVGDTFDMQVLLDTGGHETDGVDLIVLYDPGVLAVQDTDPITGTQISAGSLYTNTRANTVVPSLGEIRYSADVGEDGSAFQGSGTLATINFTVTAAISNTAVEVYYQDGWTGESNIVESETITDVLGYANIASLQTTGTPSRPMPSISFAPASNAFVNTSLVKLEAEATDPHNQVKEVEFEVNLSGVWTTIGSDTFDPYWKYRWDASSVPDGVYDLRASALLLGGEGTTVTNSNIMLDRTLPTYVSSTITLLGEPYVGVPVAIEVTADDEGSGVDHIDVYARKVYDSAVYGAWKFIGSIPGSQGSLVWNTSGYSGGTYQIAFSIQDKAGNWGPDSQPELLLGLKGKIFLPVILKNSDGTAPSVETLR